MYSVTWVIAVLHWSVSVSHVYEPVRNEAVQVVFVNTALVY